MYIFYMLVWFSVVVAYHITRISKRAYRLLTCTPTRHTLNKIEQSLQVIDVEKLKCRRWYMTALHVCSLLVLYWDVFWGFFFLTLPSTTLKYRNFYFSKWNANFNQLPHILMSTLHSTVKLYDLCTFALSNNKILWLLFFFLSLAGIL